MREFLNEILAMAIVFICIWFYARKKQKELEPNANIKENLLKEFALKFDEVKPSDIKEFNELCEYLASKNLLYKFSKSTTKTEFLQAIKPKLKNKPKADEGSVDATFLTSCALNLNSALAMGIYALCGDTYVLFLEDENRILGLVNLADKLNKNIILCDNGVSD